MKMGDFTEKPAHQSVLWLFSIVLPIVGHASDTLKNVSNFFYLNFCLFSTGGIVFLFCSVLLKKRTEMVKIGAASG